jgi:hypothetical protein
VSDLAASVDTTLKFATPYSGPGAKREAKMNEREAAAAWRMSCFNWFLVAVAWIAFGFGLLLTNFHVQPKGYLIVFVISAIYGLFGYYNAISPHRGNPRIVFPLTAIAQIILVVAVMTALSYIATSANLPLADITLLAFDRALGFDFRSYLDFVNDRPWLVRILATGYLAIHWQILLIVVVLPLVGYYRRVGEFVCAFFIALVTTTCVSTLVPAIGVYGVMNLTALDFPNVVQSGYPGGYADTLRVAPLLRDGSLRMLDVFEMAGVLTFPSFHAVSAVLYTWAFWPIRRLRLINLFCNSTMIVSAPVGGGHYLVDIIAGIAVAAASIYSAQRINLALAIPTAVSANKPDRGMAPAISPERPISA